MGVGKDEACSYLSNKYGGDRLSFASPLYDIKRYAQQRCRFREEKDRQFLQYIGTDWARKKDPNVWIRLLLDESSSSKEGNLFLSDLRFSNEFEILKKEGWVCVKINRPLVDDERKGSGIVNHDSEIDLDTIDDKEWDFIIQNNQSMEDFYSRLDNLYFKIWKYNINILKEPRENNDLFLF